MPPKDPSGLPKASELQAFGHAVAGHAGTLCDADGVLFIKPCVQAEIDFYEAVRDGHPELADLMPLFMGTLMLSDAESAGLAPLPPPPPPSASRAQPDNVTWVPRGSKSIATDRAVVLENATHGFKKPNVLDVKLGRRLWGDSAPLQKRQRMDKVCAQTTHAQFGFRIAGMRVFRGSADPADLDADGYRVYDKDYGSKHVNNDNVVDAFRRFLFNPAAGIDDAHARAIAQAFRADLARVCDVLERERTRMFSSSLLFVFEGDGDALRAAVEEGNASGSDARRRRRNRGPEKTAPARVVEPEAACDEPVSVPGPVPGPVTVAAPAAATASAFRLGSRREALGTVADRSSSRTDSGIVIDEDDEDDGEAVAAKSRGRHAASDDGYDEGGSDLDAMVDDDADSDDADSLPHIYSLRLIDFAHAKFVAPEDGPDENNLAGIRSLLRIFDELAK